MGSDAVVIPTSPITVTLAVISEIFGKALACMIAAPPPMPLTGRLTVVLFARRVTVWGTDATPVLLELTFITRSFGSGEDRMRNNCCVAFAASVKLDGEKVMASVDNTFWLTVENPGAEALRVAVPNPIPFTFGKEDGAVAPPGINTFGVTLTIAESLLSRVRKRPPAGAGVVSAIARGADWPTLTVTLAGITMPPAALVSE